MRPVITLSDDGSRVLSTCLAQVGRERYRWQMPPRPFLCALTLVAAVSMAAKAQRTDPTLLAAIRGIKAIDNHSHPPALVAAGQKDDEFDALPCDPLEPTDPALSSRPDNPRFLAAWKALYGYKYNDADSAHLRELLAAKQRVKPRRATTIPRGCSTSSASRPSW